MSAIQKVGTESPFAPDQKKSCQMALIDRKESDVAELKTAEKTVDEL